MRWRSRFELHLGGRGWRGTVNPVTARSPRRTAAPSRHRRRLTESSEATIAKDGKRRPGGRGTAGTPAFSGTQTEDLAGLHSHWLPDGEAYRDGADADTAHGGGSDVTPPSLPVLPTAVFGVLSLLQERVQTSGVTLGGGSVLINNRHLTDPPFRPRRTPAGRSSSLMLAEISTAPNHPAVSDPNAPRPRAAAT